MTQSVRKMLSTHCGLSMWMSIPRSRSQNRSLEWSRSRTLLASTCMPRRCVLRCLQWRRIIGTCIYLYTNVTLSLDVTTMDGFVTEVLHRVALACSVPSQHVFGHLYSSDATCIPTKALRSWVHRNLLLTCIQEDAKDAFKQLLRDKKITSESTWEQAMRLITNDSRCPRDRLGPKACRHPLPQVMEAEASAGALFIVRCTMRWSHDALILSETMLICSLVTVLSRRTPWVAQVWCFEGVGGEEGLLQRVPAAAEERGEGGGSSEVH